MLGNVFFFNLKELHTRLFPALDVLPLRRALQAEQPQRNTADIWGAARHIY